ncbi:4-hydroxyphenylacetate 3-monooxygenase [Brucella endophytica]|uniref:4-hydroxyphenylacetate 3-monooxygenase n=2 Tax=Brucella endophytica TaxID=1963359 RepID=A0A916WBN2_9HYPH|nr:4-hydroxyphenylacetate 3-monooxygenase [Brucella endophytica]
MFTGSHESNVPDVKDEPLKTPAIDPQSYRDAMSHFAGAVHVVTTDGPAGRRGVTISAACSVSDHPATVLICLLREHEQNRLFVENGVFALNTLAAKHRPLSEAFSGRMALAPEERFALGDWEVMLSGAPVLTDALAVFDCRIVEKQDFATHYVLFGEVLDLRLGRQEEALIYLNRRYHTLDL